MIEATLAFEPLRVGVGVACKMRFSAFRRDAGFQMVCDLTLGAWHASVLAPPVASLDGAPYQGAGCIWSHKDDAAKEPM